MSKPICPDGYHAVGLAVKSWDNDYNKNMKCVPSECVEAVEPRSAGKMIWQHFRHQFDWGWVPGWEYAYRYDVNALSSWKENPDPSYNNSYNFFNLPRHANSESYYGIKKTCLERLPNTDFPVEPQIPTPPPTTKEVEKGFADLGIGWYGHPYKLDPKYSIFSYMNLVPEGMIVNKGTGQRFYIVHVEGNDINLFNILVYNTETTKYDGALQAADYNKNGTGFSVQPNNVQGNYIENGVTDQNVSTMNAIVNHGPRIKRIEVTTLNTTNISQQWKIILNQQDKKILKLKNVYKNTYLFISQDPKEGFAEFTTIDIDNDNYKNDPAFSDIARDELDNRTNFSFIPSFGTHLNIIDNDDNA
jgi:hypothetical protein